jgi:hypothetical protein
VIGETALALICPSPLSTSCVKQLITHERSNIELRDATTACYRCGVLKRDYEGQECSIARTL